MKRTIVLLLSLVAGLIAAVLSRVYIASGENEIRREQEALRRRYGTIDALCFVRDVPEGTVLARSDLGLRTVPALGMRGQALERADLADVVGRRTLISHRKGEVAFWSDVEGGSPRTKGLSADVRRQMRAMSINVSGSAAVSGMVRPNDHVDVIGTFNLPDAKAANGERDELVTCTILQNVLVLATGRDTAKSLAAASGSVLGASYATVTLEVTPREAEMLAFAEQIRGRLVLTLRNRNDASYEKRLPQVDYSKIREEIEDLNLKRQAGRTGGR
ncbi:MAG TPA: Flp pilus assembly protein CpaB [Verrucomicrobia bacterium]|nr:Flp pilus assembly protein CpaB [Verrucomicrobiota bacterium]